MYVYICVYRCVCIYVCIRMYMCGYTSYSSVFQKYTYTYIILSLYVFCLVFDIY